MTKQLRLTRESQLLSRKNHLTVANVGLTFFITDVMAGTKIMQTIRSPWPAVNVCRRHEPVATDTFCCQVPAVCTGGQTMGQFFVGRISLVIDIFGMLTEKEFVNTFEDVIRKRGAMNKLLSNSAQVEISARVKDILRALIIDDWQSEPNISIRILLKDVGNTLRRTSTGT